MNLIARAAVRQLHQSRKSHRRSLPGRSIGLGSLLAGQEVPDRRLETPDSVAAKLGISRTATHITTVLISLVGAGRVLHVVDAVIPWGQKVSERPRDGDDVGYVEADEASEKLRRKLTVKGLIVGLLATGANAEND